MQAVWGLAMLGLWALFAVVDVRFFPPAKYFKPYGVIKRRKTPWTSDMTYQHGYSPINKEKNTESKIKYETID
jgi:hypothetical protein